LVFGERRRSSDVEPNHSNSVMDRLAKFAMITEKRIRLLHVVYYTATSVKADHGG